MFLRDRALVGSQNPALQQTRNAVDSRHRDMCRIIRGAQDRALMGVATLRSAVVTAPAIRLNDGARCHRLAHEPPQIGIRGSGHLAHPDATVTLGFFDF